jgi:DNA invertase Pin-like site-specific DNA recombinase
MKKVAGYIRVSKKEQDYETQHQRVLDYCKDHNYELYDLYKDKFTGKEFSRPDFDRMLSDMRDGKFNVIVVYKLDRIGRSLKHLLNLFEEFKNRGVEFVSLTQNFDTSTPEGELQLHFMMLLADYERKLISVRTQDALDYKQEQIKEFGFFTKRDGTIVKKLGRPKGSSDKHERPKSGYHVAWVKRKHGMKNSPPEKL